MKPSIILLILLAIPQFYFSQDKSKILLTNKKNEVHLSIKLPAYVNYQTKDGKILNGIIYKQKDSILYLKTYLVDSAKISNILKNQELSRKQKRIKIDSLYDADAQKSSISIESLSYLNIPLGHVKEFRYKWYLYTLSAIFLVGSVRFLYVTTAMTKISVFDAINGFAPVGSMMMPIFTNQKKSGLKTGML